MNVIGVFPYQVPAVWLPHLGDKRVRLDRSPIQRGGGVSFAYHLGKPLSVSLWEDLYERLLCVSFNVYGPGFDEQKTTASLWLPWACIALDDKFLVQDVQIFPV